MNKYKLLEVLNQKAGGEFRQEIKNYYKKEIDKKLTLLAQHSLSDNIELLDSLLTELDTVILDLEETEKMSKCEFELKEVQK